MKNWILHNTVGDLQGRRKCVYLYSHLICFCSVFAVLFQVSRAKGTPHGPPGLWWQWFWTIHGPRPLIPADLTPTIHLSFSLCYCQPSAPLSCQAGPSKPLHSLSAISLLPLSLLLLSPLPSWCLLAVSWPWRGLLWQIWMAMSFSALQLL